LHAKSLQNLSCGRSQRGFTIEYVKLTVQFLFLSSRLLCNLPKFQNTAALECLIVCQQNLSAVKIREANVVTWLSQQAVLLASAQLSAF